MTVIAAFLWNKSPRPSISTMIFDKEDIQFLSTPNIKYFPESYLRFRKASKNVIKDFFSQIKDIQKKHKQNIVIEFKIVFQAHEIPYLIPAKESLFVYNTFIYFTKIIKRKNKKIRIQPQLRRKLSGKELKHFKNELRSLHLVRRKRETSFEYHLWAVALHATSSNYEEKLVKIRKKMLNAMWNDDCEA